MGNVATITHDRWPQQSSGHPPGAQLWVMFHYDTSHMLRGTVVRNDAEAPYRMIIRLDDGRYVLADECQYADGPPRSNQETPHAIHP